MRPWRRSRSSKLGVSFGHLQVLKDLNLEVERRRVHRPPRPFGLREVDAAQRHRRAPRHQCRPDLDRRQERHLGGAEGPRHRHGVPVLRALPAHDGGGEPDLRPPGRARAARTRSRAASSRRPTLLQIKPLLQRRPAELSGGQRQRVAIGRALVRDVDVFLFDEPLSNLDAKLRTELRVELKKLHKQLGSTMIYVTHDQIEALTLADRIAVMHGGVIQQLATPKEIYRRPVNRFVAGFVGSPAMNFVEGKLARANGAAALRLADGDDGRPRRLRLRRHSRAKGGRSCSASGRSRSTLKAAGGPSPLPVEVSLIEPMGADSLLWGTVGDGHGVGPHRARRRLHARREARRPGSSRATPPCSTPRAASASEAIFRSLAHLTEDTSKWRPTGYPSSSTARANFPPLEAQLEALAAIGFDAVEPYRGNFGDDAGRLPQEARRRRPRLPDRAPAGRPPRIRPQGLHRHRRDPRPRSRGPALSGRGEAAEGCGRLEGLRREADRACRGTRRSRPEARLAHPRLRIREARRRLASDRRADRRHGRLLRARHRLDRALRRRHPRRAREVPRQDRRLPRQGHRAGRRHQGRRLDRRRRRHHRLEGRLAGDRRIPAATCSCSRTTIRPTGAASRRIPTSSSPV